MQNKLAIDLIKERLIRLQSNYKEGTTGHNCFGIAANLCDEYKEDEKKLIKDAFNQGYREGFNDAQNVTENEKDVSEYDDAENYYKNTYNIKEKYCVCKRPTLGSSISRCGNCNEWFNPVH